MFIIIIINLRYDITIPWCMCVHNYIEKSKFPNSTFFIYVCSNVYWTKQSVIWCVSDKIKIKQTDRQTDRQTYSLLIGTDVNNIQTSSTSSFPGPFPYPALGTRMRLASETQSTLPTECLTDLATCTAVSCNLFASRDFNPNIFRTFANYPFTKPSTPTVSTIRHSQEFAKRGLIF